MELLDIAYSVTYLPPMQVFSGAVSDCIFMFQVSMTLSALFQVYGVTCYCSSSLHREKMISRSCVEAKQQGHNSIPEDYERKGTLRYISSSR